MLCGWVTNVVRCMWQGADGLSGLLCTKRKCSVGVSSGDKCIQIIQQGGEQVEMDCYM